MNPTDRPSGHEGTALAAELAELSRVPEAHHSKAAPSDGVHHPPAPQATAHGRFIVDCPSCGGSGRVFRDGSQVQLACRLCWERGVVARIVADKYLRNNRPAPRVVRPEDRL